VISAVIDTDPGLDDAVAILYALAAPGLEVLGLATVAGNIGLDLTTRNARRLLALAGAALPVAAGAAAPLARPARDERRIHGEDGLGGVILPEVLPAPFAPYAPDWLAALLSARPAGSVDLFCLGPLTNLALLLDRAPAAARRLGRVIAMGGAIREPGNVGPRAEFNLAHDPEAAARVFAAGLDLTLVPLDVTRRVRAGPGWLARLAASPRPRAAVVRALVAAYFDRAPDALRPESRPLHDPCVPLLALCPALFGVEAMELAVDLAPGHGAGALIPGPHPVKVAMRVDGPAAIAELALRLE